MPSTSNTKVSVLAPTLRWPGRSPASIPSVQARQTRGARRPYPSHGRSAHLALAALAGDDLQLQPPTVPPTSLPLRPTQPFDADALEYHFPTTVAAKLAIAQELGLPLSKLSPDARAFIDHVLEDTRMRRLVLGRIRAYFRAKPSGADHAG